MKACASGGEWAATPAYLRATNVARLMQQVGAANYDELHAWSVEHRADYWRIAIERLGINFQKPPSSILGMTPEGRPAGWLPDAELNIVESCFQAPADATAIISQREGGSMTRMTYGELKRLVARVASSVRLHGFMPGDAIALILPMTADAVAIYLGIVAAGCVVVGIPDSFQPKEISARLQLANAKAAFTQDVQVRGGKELPLYATVVEANAPMTIVLPARAEVSVPLRPSDRAWRDFIGAEAEFSPAKRRASDPINILFSSGTTGEPKAIPWTQIVPIKCAADAHFHQDVGTGDVVVWPTNMGWMMGPWLIFASLLNGAAIGLYEGAPTGRSFALFVQDARATMLGVVPSLVKAWRQSGCVEGLDWSSIRTLSSTGECSQPGDMQWLMAVAGDRPVIEYCGGTEIGGAYLTGTLAKPCRPGLFNTPALGLDVVILDDQGRLADEGELFIVPPSIGLSETLLNRDHDEIYFEGCPPGPQGQRLRRHGDQMSFLAGGFWRAHGRADDTMNLGGIKVSSAEIERTVQSVPGILETAAIAVSPGGGPSLLVIYAVVADGHRSDADSLLRALQDAIKRDLNPLFKVHAVVPLASLPRTASNKIMRRVLRDQYDSEV